MQKEMKPIDILLFCPNCAEQHIDAPEPENCQDCGHRRVDHYTNYNKEILCHNCACEGFNAWSNPPHKSHRCHFCNIVWRPSDHPTNGVVTIDTKGENDGNPRPRYFATAEDFKKAISTNRH